jgi:hypothetical protein
MSANLKSFPMRRVWLVPFASRTREGGRWSEEERAVRKLHEVHVDIDLTDTGGVLPFSVIHAPAWRTST